MATVAGTTGSPCGACKFLRRKCTADCIFAPYFCSEQGPARFAAIHKVFGASNVSKLLHHVAVADRCETVVTIAYEAQARIRDPVYGCVSHIFALQQQVACLQAQLMQVKAQMAAQGYMDSRNLENQWSANMAAGAMAYQDYMNGTGNFMNCNISPQSSMESIDHNNEGNMGMQEIQSRDDDHHHDHGFSFQPAAAVYSNKKRLSDSDLGELQELAVRMMRN
ncbi:LOB domain-containing protein 16-like [Cynara cardunculus var. scolymus]|uniref:LOB domain-containing protein 16-like n=1 Tax=Cynara cardunculus var. scolymus TaxID=59895 RepID=UPI000D627F70|nr:LOB domain-containing protein 16-like [Cynara cardunculus var. scolymus]